MMRRHPIDPEESALSSVAPKNSSRRIEAAAENNDFKIRVIDGAD